MTVVQNTPAGLGNRVRPRRDAIYVLVLVLASILSLTAFVVVYNNGHTLAYGDAVSHMMIARRVVEGSTPDAAQLGSVWPPLTHVLMLPFVMSDFLYFSGIAGAVISMLAFVVCVGLMYKILHRLTGVRAAGVVAAVIFAVNSNILYMQSTPMTELPLYAALLGVLYYIQVWADDRRYQNLVAAGASAFAATLIRYESWVILLVLTAVVLFASYKERRHGITGKQQAGRVADLMATFTIAAFSGIGLWLVWNLVLFGDMLAFMRGDYAKPALWLTNNEPAIGNLSLSIKTFFYATIENVHWLLIVAAIIGLCVFFWIEVVKGKLHARSLVAPSLLAIIPFFIGAIYTGSRPLHTLQTNDGLYNIRFGLIMVIPVALFAGYAVSLFRKFRGFRILLATFVVGLTLGISYMDITGNHVVTLNDPVAALKEDRAVWAQGVIDGFKPLIDADDAALRAAGVNPDETGILVETFGNERLAFMTIPSNRTVYEGTNRDGRWKSSLLNPSGNNIRWIVMRCLPGGEDKVCTALRGNSAALADYDLVFTYKTGDNPHGYMIYRKR